MRFLRDETLIFDRFGARLELVGLDQYYGAPDRAREVVSDRRRGAATILLTHYPSTVYRLPLGRVDLQLSGHTHGGQVRIPPLGCIWPSDAIPRRIARGLHRIGDTLVHVTAGLGGSPPLWLRVNCPPEVALLTLRPAAWARPALTDGRPAVTEVR